MKKIIWSYDYGTLAEWKEFIDEQINEGYLKENCSDREKHNAIRKMNRVYLDDEIMNLNIPTENQIIEIISDESCGDNIRAYKMFSKNNINTILRHSTKEKMEWYCDGYNIKAIGKEHNKTNYYEFREIRADKNWMNLLIRIAKGKPVSRKIINHYTKSIAPQVKAVYGW